MAVKFTWAGAPNQGKDTPKQRAVNDSIDEFVDEHKDYYYVCDPQHPCYASTKDELEAYLKTKKCDVDQCMKVCFKGSQMKKSGKESLLSLKKKAVEEKESKRASREHLLNIDIHQELSAKLKMEREWAHKKHEAKPARSPMNSKNKAPKKARKTLLEKAEELDAGEVLDVSRLNANGKNEKKKKFQASKHVRLDDDELSKFVVDTSLIESQNMDVWSGAKHMFMHVGKSEDEADRLVKRMKGSKRPKSPVRDDQLDDMA